MTGDDRTRSGLPSAHSPGLSSLSGGGASFGLPSGAPLSAHLAISSISSSDSELSSFTFWMPMFRSRNHGGMEPRDHGALRSAVRRFISRAYGRASAYVSSDIGAREFGLWHRWQLR